MKNVTVKDVVGDELQVVDDFERVAVHVIERGGQEKGMAFLLLKPKAARKLAKALKEAAKAAEFEIEARSS